MAAPSGIPALPTAASISASFARDVQMVDDDRQSLRQRLSDPSPLPTLYDLLMLLQDVSNETDSNPLQDIQGILDALRQILPEYNLEDRQIVFDHITALLAHSEQSRLSPTELLQYHNCTHRFLHARSTELIHKYQGDLSAVAQLLPFLPPEQQAAYVLHLPPAVFNCPSADSVLPPIDTSRYAPLTEECEQFHLLNEQLAALFFKKIHLEYEIQRSSERAGMLTDQNRELEEEIRTLEDRVVYPLSTFIQVKAIPGFYGNFDGPEEVAQFIAAAQFLLTVNHIILATLRLTVARKPEAIAKVTAIVFGDVAKLGISITDVHRAQSACVVKTAKDHIVAAAPQLFPSDVSDGTLGEEITASQVISEQFQQVRDSLATLVRWSQQNGENTQAIGEHLVGIREQLLQVVSGFESEEDPQDALLYEATLSLATTIQSLAQHADVASLPAFLAHFEQFIKTIVKPWAEAAKHSAEEKAPSSLDLVMAKLGAL